MLDLFEYCKHSSILRCQITLVRFSWRCQNLDLMGTLRLHPSLISIQNPLVFEFQTQRPQDNRIGSLCSFNWSYPTSRSIACPDPSGSYALSGNPLAFQSSVENACSEFPLYVVLGTGGLTLSMAVCDWWSKDKTWRANITDPRACSAASCCRILRRWCSWSCITHCGITAWEIEDSVPDTKCWPWRI